MSLRVFFANGTPSLKLFSLACLLTVAAEGLGYYFRSKGQGAEEPGSFATNHWVYNVYHYLYFMVVGRAYFNQLTGDLMRALIQLFRIGFTAFFLINSFLIQGIGTYQTLTVVVGGSFVMILSLAYFWELLVSLENEKLSRDPFFWISFGLILFYGGTIPFLGMLNFLSRRFYDFTVLYQLYIFNGFTIFLNTLIIIGFLCRKSFQK